MKRPAIIVIACVFALGCGEGKTDGPEPAEQEPEPAAEKPEPAVGKPEPAVEKNEPDPNAVAVADVILLKPEGGSKKAISFPHAMHTDAAANPAVGGKCEVCHHEVGDASEARKCTSAGCHDNKTANVPSAMDSFHQTCRDGCHKKVRASQPDNAKLARLRTCTGCHAH